MASTSTIDSSDTSISYYPSGSWRSACSLHDGSLGDCFGSNSSIGRFRYTFTGTGIEVIALLGGIDKILPGNVWVAAVDGTTMGEVYTASFPHGQTPTTTTIFSTSGLSEAPHTLRVNNLRDTETIILWLDSLVVISPEASHTETTQAPTQPTTSFPSTSIPTSSQVKSTLVQPTSSRATSTRHSSGPSLFPSERHKEINVSAVVGGTVAGTVLVSLLALLLYRTRRRHYDRRAFRHVGRPSAPEGSTRHSFFSATSSRSSGITTNGRIGRTSVPPSALHTSNQSTLAETIPESLSALQHDTRENALVDCMEKDLGDHSVSTPQQEAGNQSDHLGAPIPPVTVSHQEYSASNDTNSHALPVEVDAALSYAPRELQSQVAAILRSLLMRRRSRTGANSAPSYRRYEEAEDEPLPQYSER